MKILAIDTSLGKCSVALWRGEAVIAASEEEMGGQQSRVLMPMIEKLLGDNGLSYAHLDAFACTIGPGGFTGIRVGLTAARVLALAADKPLVGLTTLEVIAYGSGHQGDVLAMVDAYRGQYYVQRFRMAERMSPLSDVLLVEESQVSSLAHGAKKVEAQPKASHIAALAYARWQAGERHFPTQPLYVREPDAKLPA